jgi:glycosyltransferase involved in cell wall biosynthesis
LEALAKELGITDRYRSFDDYLPRGDVYALTNACDVYLSLHRGEGFGLGIAEAMSMGKPVIVSNCGGCTEFCNPENSILISTKTIQITKDQADHPCYLSVTSCAEPDIGAAVEALRRLHNSPELRRELGEAGKAFVEKHFAVDNFKNSVKAFLDTST